MPKFFAFPTAGASLQLVPNSKFRIQNSELILLIKNYFIPLHLRSKQR
ncbi:hypothetical protein HMPREF9075_00776 [Capnocytophaga sp. oral taxon 332 str. F0381]|nr:hypothetical protein HMPREF9075_00776 [Capnocytophaga sp. oral taxon 332 str. F0381]